MTDATRKCGDCQLCCKLLPVSEIGKPAATRCEHQRHGKGCAIYARRPRSCQLWSCQWLTHEDTRDLKRPDRAHYVIDPLPDYIRLRNDDDGSVREIPVIQIWLDKKFPDAHRDPALRAWLAKRYDETGMLALVRMPGNNGAIGLFPPASNNTHEWGEMVSIFQPEMQHDAADIARVMTASGLKIEGEAA
jgi:hypothetical protein